LSGDTPGNAVLCTPDKTFNIRQKNSSNTVYILQPGQGDTSSIAEPGLIGISKPESTLETLPITNFTAAAHIRRLLPVLTTTGQLTGTHDSSTKSQLLKNVPFSDSECEVAYRELSVFVQSTTDHCIVPSAQLKIETWLSMLENTRANGIDLTSELDQDAMLSLKDGLEDLETSLCDAIVHSFTSTNAEGRTSIDSDRLLRWVGLNRLEADALKTPISIATFKASWKDALPEKLRGKVEISLLSDRHQLSAGGKSIAFKDYALDLAVGADSAGVAGAKSTLGTKRKWHDKFKPAKKAA
jgi:sister chromatid cohesion protein DCC1